MRFDPKLVETRLPKSGYRLIYPKEAPLDPGIYDKITKRAHEMFKEATGTVIKFRPDQI